MMRYRNILRPALTAICFIGTFFFCTAQDENKILPITYPPLTEREGKGITIPKPPAEHPRLFFTSAYIPALGEKTEHSLTYELWNRILDNGKSNTSGSLDLKAIDNYDLKVRDAIEAKALIYALSKKEEYGKDAIKILFNFYRTVKFDPKKSDVIRSIGRAITTGSMVYDWCYDLLDADQKKQLIGYMETFAGRMEIKWPQLLQGSIVSHAVEAQMSRDMLACGVATYDENPEIYNRVAGRIMAEYVPARKYFYPAGYHHQGSAYGPYRYIWDMVTTYIFDRMGYPQIYGSDQAKVPYIWIYTRRPDGQLFRNGDDFNDNYFKFGQYFNYTFAANAYTGSYYKDPILLGQAFKDGQLGKNNDDFIFDFLFYDTKVRIDTNLNKLPLSKFFPEPYGGMVARTGWNDGMINNEVVVQMKAGGRGFANHEHMDAGNFQIYCNGPLAINSGVYQGKFSNYGGEHFKNYYQRTIAHNSLLVYDPNEEFKWWDNAVLNDGGQRITRNAKEPVNMAELMLDDYKTGEVVAHFIGPDTLKPTYSYLKGNITSAYSAKVKKAERSFLFINTMDKKSPAVLVVYDVVTAADKNFKKTWLLHSVEQPAISGNQVIIKRTEKGYNGKLINTTVYPTIDSVDIKKVGGSTNAFSVAGKNFPQEPYDLEKSSADGASWRVEISPHIPAETDIFLNVMQITPDDGGPKKPMLVEKIATEKFVGTVFSNRIVLFSKTGNTVDEDFNLNISGKDEMQVFIADVKEGNWKIETLEGTLITEKKSNGQTISFTVKPGQYRIKR